MSIAKIAILGDFNPHHYTLNILNESIGHIKKHLQQNIQFNWIDTDVFNAEDIFGNQAYKGLWIAPGSPYKDFDNVLKVIEYARLKNIPTLGNCGGFQHMLIEFARNVCSIQAADHEESNPETTEAIIHKLSCSLKGGQEELQIIGKNSLMFSIIQKEIFIGKFNCSYGLNKKYIPVLQNNGLIFTTKSDSGEYRSFEIKNHPFYMGTLFQPALSSTQENPDPIIISFIKKSLE